MYLEVCVCKSCFKKLHMFQCALNLYRTFQFRLINLPACSWHGRISVAFAVYQCTQTFKWLCDPSAHMAFVAPLSEIWASLRPTELENNKSFAADWSFSIMLIRPHIVCTDKAAEIWSALIVYIFSLTHFLTACLEPHLPLRHTHTLTNCLLVCCLMLYVAPSLFPFFKKKCM